MAPLPPLLLAQAGPADALAAASEPSGGGGTCDAARSLALRGEGLPPRTVTLACPCAELLGTLRCYRRLAPHHGQGAAQRR